MALLYEAARKRIKKLLLEIYPEEHLTEDYLNKLYGVIEENLGDVTCSLAKWDERDTVLITYGNSITREEEKPLHTLHNFLKEYLYDEFQCLHILPFFPYSSDDGFSVIDYYQVDRRLGDWDDIRQINQDYDLMVDLVINHVSSKSQWFRNYLEGNSPGKDFFIEANPQTDVSQVTRPRNTPLLTEFQTSEGKKLLWTTFSEDQVDLDFSNPWVLYEMLRVLFFYINKGARVIRLDAIAYLWKESGTTCIHLPQTHKIVKFIRELAELINPDIIILTQTNVPDRENRSYFGKNFDEAHMVYQSPLPPLMLYTLHTGNSEKFTAWVKSIPETEGEATYFNFTASHDGIGVRPAEGIIPAEEISEMADKMKDFGGYIKTKTNQDGSESPCEINITWFDALKGTSKGEDDLQKERFLCSQTIMMSLRGIPGFYIHSLIATKNDHELVKKTRSYKIINLKTRYYYQLTERLTDGNHFTSEIFTELKRLIRIRISQPAFHPDAGQEVLDLGNAFFGIKRSYQSNDKLWSISNITSQKQAFTLSREIFPNQSLTDLTENKTYKVNQALTLNPYQTLWIKPD